MMVNLTKTFQISALYIAISIATSAAFAIENLEALDDYSLGESTGEGIAFLPTDTTLRFNGAEEPNSSGVTPNSLLDTGYIRYIPVGPLTGKVQDTNKDNYLNSYDRSVGKADLFLYGLAISKADGNSNNRFSGNSISTWGTAANPWLLKVVTARDIPNFDTGNNTLSGVTYLGWEAPLFDNTIPTQSNSGADAYNLKLGMWADAFVRNPNVVEDMTTTGNQFNLGQNYGTTQADRANRIRLQAVWDGFGINGTQIRIFQTLGGAPNSNGMSKFYNNTLGISGLLRLNSGASNTAASRGAATSTSAVWATGQSTTNTYTVPGACTGANLANFANANCIQQERKIERVARTTTNWQAPNINKVLRLSSQEMSDTGKLLTPAINGGGAPTFRPNTGLYIYNLNANVVLGSLYQPLVLGVANDGRNLTLEVARIPDKSSIYNKIYTDYSKTLAEINAPGYTGAQGSTCNIHYCGKSDFANYQGNSATHSSISIGSTDYNSGMNILTAHKGVGAVGISFGPLVSGSVQTEDTFTQAQVQLRSWDSRVRCSGTSWGTCVSKDVGAQSWGGWSGWSNVERTTFSSSPVITSPGGIPNVANPPARAAAPSNNLGSAAIDGLLIQHLKISTTGL